MITGHADVAVAVLPRFRVDVVDQFRDHCGEGGDLRTEGAIDSFQFGDLMMCAGKLLLQGLNIGADQTSTGGRFEPGDDVGWVFVEPLAGQAGFGGQGGDGQRAVAALRGAGEQSLCRRPCPSALSTRRLARSNVLCPACFGRGVPSWLSHNHTGSNLSAPSRNSLMRNSGGSTSGRTSRSAPSWSTTASTPSGRTRRTSHRSATLVPARPLGPRHRGGTPGLLQVEADKLRHPVARPERPPHRAFRARRRHPTPKQTLTARLRQFDSEDAGPLAWSAAHKYRAGGVAPRTGTSLIDVVLRREPPLLERTQHTWAGLLSANVYGVEEIQPRLQRERISPPRALRQPRTPDARQNALTLASDRPAGSKKNGVPSRAPFRRAHASRSPAPGARSSTDSSPRRKS